jgi:aspartyl-tRNA synthetase
MSFVEQDDIMKLNEQLLIELVGAVCPDKSIQQVPFPRLSYSEAMKTYGTDRLDLRKDASDNSTFAFCWVIDFPFFEKNDDGSWTFTHNPFSAPKPEYSQDVLTRKNIPSILTTQYDITCNGWEIGGGSLRNHDPQALKAVFKILGLSDQQIRERFGHMLEAFSYGAPPHGGIAWGLDRLIAVLANEPDIREVIAFPKTSDGRDLMMGAPSELPDDQLREAHITSRKDDA